MTWAPGNDNDASAAGDNDDDDNDGDDEIKFRFVLCPDKSAHWRQKLHDIVNHLYDISGAPGYIQYISYTKVWVFHSSTLYYL